MAAAVIRCKWAISTSTSWNWVTALPWVTDDSVVRRRKPLHHKYNQSPLLLCTLPQDLNCLMEGPRKINYSLRITILQLMEICLQNIARKMCEWALIWYYYLLTGTEVVCRRVLSPHNRFPFVINFVSRPNRDRWIASLVWTTFFPSCCGYVFTLFFRLFCPQYLFIALYLRRCLSGIWGPSPIFFSEYEVSYTIHY